MGRQGCGEVPGEELRHDHEEDRVTSGDGHADGPHTGGGQGTRIGGQ